MAVVRVPYYSTQWDRTLGSTHLRSIRVALCFLSEVKGFISIKISIVYKNV